MSAPALQQRTARTLIVVREVVARLLDELVRARVGHHLGVGREELVQVRLRVRDEQGADAGCLVEPHVVRIFARLGDVPVQDDAGGGEQPVHVEAPSLAVVAAADRRPGRPAPQVVAPELEREAPCRPGQGRVAAAVPDAVQRPGEDDIVLLVVSPSAAEHALVKADPEVLRLHAERAKPLDEMRERGEDQVEHPQPLVRRRLARDLPDDERGSILQRAHRLVGEDVEVLEVDHVRRELVHLPQQDRLRRGVREPVLPGPGGLERLAVDDHLVGVVAEASELERVGVGGAEARVHQRPPLLLVWPLGEARVRP